MNERPFIADSGNAGKEGASKTIASDGKTGMIVFWWESHPTTSAITVVRSTDVRGFRDECE
jgi:hypothetical protein